ncbi:MAG TPA: glycosyltransferase, partial [Longimicrobiaceae bacterium]|nr:glycosyltransferase [Longimicrobiaceae bacterium]
MRFPHADARAQATGESPALSLVVASRGEPRALRALLGALLPLAGECGVEVVVARGGAHPETAGLAREFPGVRFFAAPEDATPQALRFTGMAEATGDVVMLAADDDPSAPERLLHLCRTYAAAEP